MSEERQSDTHETVADGKWTAYNRKMAVLFAERDTHPVNSAERHVAAERILALWVTEGQ